MYMSTYIQIKFVKVWIFEYKLESWRKIITFTILKEFKNNI